MAENPRIEELRRRVEADPASIAFAALAEEFRRVGRYQDAIETCRTGLQRHPAYLSARVTLGRALIETGEYEAAQAELETVLQSAPENLAATRGLAQIHERLGHSTEMHPDLHALVEDKRTERLELEQTRKREQERLDLEAAARERAAREHAAREQAEQAVRDEAAREAAAARAQAAREEAAREQAAREQAARDQEARDQVTRDQAARELTGREQASIAPAAPEPPPAVPISLDSFVRNPAPASAPAPTAADEPFDIFGAALRRQSEAAPPEAADPFAMPARVPEPPPPSPFTFEPSTTPEPQLPPRAPELDAHVAAALVRLERFLGAIHAARHA